MEPIKPNTKKVARLFCHKCREDKIHELLILSCENNKITLTRQCIPCQQGYHSLRLNVPTPELEQLSRSEYEELLNPD